MTVLCVPVIRVKMFKGKYLTSKHLKGFDNYKYSAIDTSPLSNYVMHPLWNLSVKVIPEWIAPNLITFVGFLCLLGVVVLLLIIDLHCYSAGRPGVAVEEYGFPNWIYTLCGILLFINYNLDGIDGKQARKIGVSGPLGELFDHGLDSYVVFFIPFCLFSVFGRDEYSVPAFRGYLIVLSVILNFYVSHWEKYNTGTLYLPWGYDLSMWVSTIFFIVAGAYGPGAYKTHVFANVTFIQFIEFTVHVTGLFTTLPVAVYNIHLSYKNRTGKMYPLFEALRPLYPITLVSIIMTTWALKSPNDIVDLHLRPFLLLLGTLFSNIASRLIVAEMSHQRCEALNWMTWPSLAGVGLSVYFPVLEVLILYVLLVSFTLSHVHYGMCVVQQICDHFKISCFTVPKRKKKLLR